jgi:hypothetical protein
MALRLTDEEMKKFQTTPRPPKQDLRRRTNTRVVLASTLREGPVVYHKLSHETWSAAVRLARTAGYDYAYDSGVGLGGLDARRFSAALRTALQTLSTAEETEVEAVNLLLKWLEGPGRCGFKRDTTWS